MLFINCANTSCYMAVFRQSLIQSVADHGISILIVILCLVKKVIHGLECSRTIVVVCIYNGKRRINQLTCCEYRMSRSPRLFASFGNLTALRYIRYILKCIMDVQVFSASLIYQSSEVLLILLFDYEDNLLKTCHHSIIKRKV